MKKKYLILSLLSAMVLSGCGNDGSSSSNNTANPSNSGTISSSTQNTDPKMTTVKEAVNNISFSYSVYYSLFDANNNKYEFKNAVETSKRADGKGDLAYYSEYNEYGYYVKADGSEAYTVYNNGEGDTIYNSTCLLEEEDIEVLKMCIDIKGNFSAAEWTFDSEKDGVISYYTDDAKVLATASFLTDYISEENPVAIVYANIKSGKLSGFTTYNADGDQLISAEIKRIGGSIAVNNTPIKVADDYVDPTFQTKWMAATNGSHIGYLGTFEVTPENKIKLSQFDQTTYNYKPLPGSYSFAGTNNIGFYQFKDESTNNMMYLKVSTGYVSFITYDAKTNTMGQDVAVEYYTAWYQMAVEACGFIMEEIPSGDINYPIITESGAAKGYYVYNVVKDPETGAEYSDMMVIMLQYTNKHEAVEESFGGDTATYNGFALAGYAFGNIVLGGYYSPESIRLVIEIAQYLMLEFADFDMSQYPVAEAGQSVLDYLINYMTSEGYSYVNKETADPDFVVNAEEVPVVNPETGEPVVDEDGNPVTELEGTNFYDEINDYLGYYSDVKYNQEGDTFSATDMYIFYRDAEAFVYDEKTGEQLFEEDGVTPKTEPYVEYTGFLVCDIDMTGFDGGYENVFNCGVGYFASTGKVLEACMTWYATKTA